MESQIQSAASQPSGVRTSAAAIQSLILALVGLSIPAVILGHIALSRIKRSGGLLTGERLARAALTIGYVETVLLILLPALVPDGCGTGLRRARTMRTEADISVICVAIDRYEKDTGRYPQTLEALIQNDGAPNWRGPYFKRGSLPTDAWGRPYSYTTDGNSYRVVSSGPDRVLGTADDISEEWSNDHTERDAK